MARKQRKQTAQKKQKQEKPRKTQPGTRPLRNSKARDSTAKLVLGDPYLCAQFLRDYVGLDIMQDVRPEDIQDVSERFLPMFVDEREADVVKVIQVPDKAMRATAPDPGQDPHGISAADCGSGSGTGTGTHHGSGSDSEHDTGGSTGTGAGTHRGGGSGTGGTTDSCGSAGTGAGTDINGGAGTEEGTTGSEGGSDTSGTTAYGFCYVLLVEHKSRNYNDIHLQLLRYIVEIWTMYRKDAVAAGLDPDAASFRYPAVLPVVYYDGKDSWAAPRDLSDRVLLADVFQEFLPRFSYLLVDLRRKHTAEFCKNGDEVSFIMLLERLRSLDEFAQLYPDIPQEMWKRLGESPEHVLEIIAQVTSLLLRGLDMREDHIRDVAGKIRERKVYHMFEDFEKPKVGLSDIIEGYYALSSEKADWLAERAGWQQREAGWQQERTGWQQREAGWQQKAAQMEQEIAALKARLQMV